MIGGGRRAVVAVLAAAAAAVAGGAAVGGAVGAATRGRPKPADPAAFELSGSVDGLYPGGVSSLAITFENTTRRSIVVSHVDVTVSDPRGSCSAGDLVVGDLATPVSIAAGGEAVSLIPVTLRAVAPDACQGVTFALRYSAVG